MLNRHRQGGLTMITWILIIFVAGVFGLVILKLVPIYMDHAAIKSAMQGVAAELAPNASPNAVRSAMEKRLGINNVRSVDDQDFEVVRDGNTAYIEITYDAKAELFANISLLVEFEESVELGVAQ